MCSMRTLYSKHIPFSSVAFQWIDTVIRIQNQVTEYLNERWLDFESSRKPGWRKLIFMNIIIFRAICKSMPYAWLTR